MLPVQIKEHVGSGDELRSLARLEETAGGAGLLKVLRAIEGRTRSELDARPRIDNEDCKRDFRYHLGIIAGLKMAREASEQAAKELEALERES